MELQLSLNKHSKATKWISNFYFHDGTVSDIEDSYVYDSNGHLTGFKRSLGWSYELTWQDGNLTKKIEKFEDEEKSRKIIAYSSIPNRTYPDLNLYLYVTLGAPVWESYWGDYLGLRSANLLSGYTNISNGNEFPRSLKYKLDAKARPVEVEMKSGDHTYIHVITYLEK